MAFAYKKFRAQASKALSQATCSPRKLVLHHALVTLGAGLILLLAQFGLDKLIADTGGLNGIGLRTTLMFIQSALEWANTILLPFWMIGYTLTMLQLSRCQKLPRHSLLTGFRNWRPVFRTLLLQNIFRSLALVIGFQIGSVLLLFSPAIQKLWLQGGAEADMYALLEDPAFIRAVLSMLPWILLCSLALYVPVYYRTRFMAHVIMDFPENGAFHAMLRSIQLTRGRFFSLVLLDLRFWWYHGLELLFLAAGVAAPVLQLCGLGRQLDADTLMLLCCSASLVCRLGLYVWRKNDVFVTYALVYDHLKSNPYIPKPKSTRTGGQVPWKY